jgi:hypothetical protein
MRPLTLGRPRGSAIGGRFGSVKEPGRADRYLLLAHNRYRNWANRLYRTEGLHCRPDADTVVSLANAGPDLDPIRLNRIKVWIFPLSMILSENRFPLFGIML